MTTRYDLDADHVDELNPGDMIRAYDHKPMPGRDELYIEGEYVDTMIDGRLHVLCTDDTVFEHGGRIGMAVAVPAPGSLIFGDYPERVQVIR